MPYYCTVPRCTSMSGKIKNVSFHQFPNDKELADLWNKILKRSRPYTRYSKVCSLHFKEEDFITNKVPRIIKRKGIWRVLKKNAIPSRNLPFAKTQIVTDSMTNINEQMQQEMEHTYTHTMLVMQAASIMAHMKSDPPSEDEISEYEVDFNTEIIHRTNRTYTCYLCSKYFKDYDVYLLHKRIHTEKENTVDNMKSNPILANMLNSTHANRLSLALD